MTPFVDVKNQSAIEAEARAWIVQLDGRAPSKEDLSALREWAGRSPQHHATLRELAQLWGELDRLAELEPLIVAAASMKQRKSAAPKIRPAWAAVAAGIALAGAATLGLFLMLRPADTASAMYATAVGEQREVTLPDGSIMRLNTNTTVEVAYQQRARRLRLVGGEALFEVATNAERPFIVSVRDSAVRAVGTSFIVRSEIGRIDVTVAEGAVALIESARTSEEMETGSTAVVVAGNTATLTDDGVAMRALGAGDLARRLAWSTGYLVFEGEPLSEVLAEIGRYTNLRFEIADPTLQAQPIGGRFPINDAEALVDALGPTFNIDVHRDGDTVRLSRRDPN